MRDHVYLEVVTDGYSTYLQLHQRETANASRTLSNLLEKASRVQATQKYLRAEQSFL